eukprot:299846-Prymnesium_polylepis.1
MISAVARRPPVPPQPHPQPNITCPCLPCASVSQETGPRPPAPLRSGRRTQPLGASRTRSTAPQSQLPAPRVRSARPGTAWRLAVRAHRKPRRQLGLAAS